jgi:ABC-type multidrug transport system fused ATPase/permease subunit
MTERSLILEIAEPGEPRRQVVIRESIDVGRACEGLVVSDAGASRRHLHLSLTDAGLVVRDLGSRNGTFVNGTPVHEETALRIGDTVTLGTTELSVLASGGALGQHLESIDGGSVEVHFRPGSSAERSARAVHSVAARAYRRLSGLDGDPTAALRPQINLVDPFEDPAHPGDLVTEGTLVDAARARIWMVVTAESPPEAPHRALALVLGAGLPAATDLAPLLEGYGLHVAGAPDLGATIDLADAQSLASAPPELRPQIARSFVRWLIGQLDEAAFLQMLKRATPASIDAAAIEIYGAPLSQLEESWRASLIKRRRVRALDFVRLSARYLRPYAWREAEMFVYMLLALAFGLTFPFILRELLDKTLPAGRFSAALGLLGILGAAFLVSLVAGVRRSLLAAKTSSLLVRQLRLDMFARLQGLSLDWFDQHGQGDVLARFFSDVSLLESGLTQTLRDGISQVLTLVSFAVVLIVLNPLLAAITLVAAPIVGIVYRLMSAETQRRSLAVQEQVAGVLGISGENYAAQQVVQAFSLARREITRFAAACDRLLRRQVSLQLFTGLFSLTVSTIVMVLRIVILGVGAWLVLHHHLTVGALVAFLSVMDQVIGPVMALSNIGQVFQSATGALARINEVMDAQPSVIERDGAEPLQPLEREIRLADISFSYTPERPVLEGVDAVIHTGMRVAFVGASGSGKSTILRLLLRFLDPDEGTVLFDGRDLRDATIASLRERVGVVFQDTFLFSGSIRENIALARPEASGEDVAAAARGAELDELAASLPQGYDTPVGERGGRLSGGERQRVAIARALLRDPQVLLLDEATSALDSRTERRIMDTLRAASKGRTTIAVTHRLRSVVDYDSIFVVSGGRLVESGTHTTLLAAGGTYAELWAEQEAGTAGTAAIAPELLAALGRLAPLALLPHDELARLAAGAETIEVLPGASFEAQQGTLAVVRSGRGELIVASGSDEEDPAGPLGPGDVLGLSALLGSRRTRFLRAVVPTSVWVIDAPALAAYAASYANDGQLAPDMPEDARVLSRLALTASWTQDPGTASLIG